MKKNLKKLSKFLAVILRHKPEQFGITLDENGWAPLDSVWQAIQERYNDRYTIDDLEAVVEGDETGKKRYEIKQDHIRALYGHSRIREIKYEPAIPPQTLYHGTNPAAASAIQQEGLKAQGRQYVHLTTNRENALNVAKRRTDNPVLLHIRARDAHEAGYVFHHAEEEHYLTHSVPPEFIDFSR